MLIISGFIAGIISGMGIGGGAVLIPLITVFCGFEQKTAQAINLIYFVPTAIIALVTHFKNGNIDKDDIKFIFPIVIFGIIGAIGGSLLASSFDNAVLRKIFAFFLVIMGIYEIIRGIKTDKKGTYQK